jgi:hypothetical protein
VVLSVPKAPRQGPTLEREVGPVALDVHRAIKDALDPAGLLNPGKVFRRASAADLRLSRVWSAPVDLPPGTPGATLTA